MFETDKILVTVSMQPNKLVTLFTGDTGGIQSLSLEMGNLLSKVRLFFSSRNYESILEKLSIQIHVNEARIRKIHEYREYTWTLFFKAFIINITLSIAYLAYLYCTIGLSGEMLWFVAKIIGFSLTVYLIFVGCEFCLNFLSSQIAKKLKELKLLQKEKVVCFLIQIEELKRNSLYYQTKSIIEKYEIENTQEKIKIPNFETRNNRRQEEKDDAEKYSSQSWIDKITDVIVGNQSTNSLYALVCKNCYSHNGLVLPEEVNLKKYICPKCGFLNNAELEKRVVENDKSKNVIDYANDLKKDERILNEGTLTDAKSLMSNELNDKRKSERLRNRIRTD